MLKNTKSREEKKYILNNNIASLGNSLFVQMLLTEFEHTVISSLEKGEKPSIEDMNDIYLNIYKKYNGDVFTYDAIVKYNWLKVPHLVMQSSYYVYQYSIGAAIATNIASRILNKEENIVSKYKKFLSVGCSVSIDEALSYLDIDLENPTYMEETYKVLKKNIETLKKL